MAIYDKFARFYDRLFAPFERRFLARWRRETLELIPDGATILELGAGTGANFEFYPQRSRSVSTEISTEMLRRASIKKRSNLLVQADAESLPFAASSFDAAFATLVFCSVPKPVQAFAEVGRVLRPGGRLILLEHVRPPGLLGYVFDLISVLTVVLIEDHFNRRTAKLAEAAGFEVVEVRQRAAGVVNLIHCKRSAERGEQVPNLPETTQNAGNGAEINF